MNSLTKAAQVISFPGAYLLSFWRRLFGLILGQNSAGTLLLTWFANLVVALPMYLLGFAVLGAFGAVPGNGGTLFFVLAIVALYLGGSLLANKYPTPKEARELWERIKAAEHLEVKIFGYPFALLMRVGAFVQASGLAVLLYLGGMGIYFIVYAVGKA
ncbi:MAG: hypothetical protein LBQ80_02495 [Clostridium sp.]|jgi:hypothetical protein|nr:hypothetical protein [Clostridium sp.]